MADDIVVAATNWQRDGGLKHPRKDNIVDFDHGKTLIYSGSNKYTAEVLVGITDTGDAVFYDVVDMKPTTFDIKKAESPTTATTQNAIGDILGDSTGDNVAQNHVAVNQQNSLPLFQEGAESRPPADTQERHGETDSHGLQGSPRNDGGVREDGQNTGNSQALGNLEGDVQKNTATEGGGVRYQITRKAYSQEDILRNAKAVADMQSIYSVPAEKLDRTGNVPSELFYQYFEQWGNNIYTEEFGDVALPRSSVKSEVRHGITAEKIASIEAIPEVLKKGKVIFAQPKNGTKVERIVVCAPIEIAGKPYYMGVMLQRDSQNQRLYLHNVLIEQEMPATSEADLVTTGATGDSEHLSITNILQKAMEIKTQYLRQGLAETQQANTKEPADTLSLSKEGKERNTGWGMTGEDVRLHSEEEVRGTESRLSDNAQERHGETDPPGQQSSPGNDGGIRENLVFRISGGKKSRCQKASALFGDPYGNRTHVTAVKGRCLNRLTNGPGSGDLT